MQEYKIYFQVLSLLSFVSAFAMDNPLCNVISKKQQAEAVTRLEMLQQKEEKNLKDSGIPLFLGMRSIFGLIPEKPEIVLRNMQNLKPEIIPADTIIAEGLIQELNKNNLLPDNHTFYVIWLGNAHQIPVQIKLLQLGIDASMYTDPTEDDLKTETVFIRYVPVYKYYWKELFDERLKLARSGCPKGLGFLINSHMSKAEESRIEPILPSADYLRKLGVKKIVFGVETYFHSGAPNPEDPESASFFSSTIIHRYIKHLFDEKFKIVTIGIDYRYREKKPEREDYAQSRQFHYKPSQEYPESRQFHYKSSPVQNFEQSICQSMEGKRMCFSKKNGEIFKLNTHGTKQTATNEEIKEFITNIFSAKIPLTLEEKKMLEKYKKSNL